MRKIILSVLAFVLIGLVVNSCQKDEISNNTISTNDKLTNKSALTNLLMRVSHSSVAKTTAKDGDESMCFTVNLPVTITINGQMVTVTGQTNYATVLNALENIDDDDSSVAFTFPITITLADGSTQVINDTIGLHTALEGCHSDDDENEDIECFNIHYPLSITFYDATGAAVVMTFNNNAELFVFLDALEDNNSFTISYPATITDANGTIIIVSSNDQLESSIEDADNQCGNNHDDDGDDGDDDGD